MQLFPSVPAEQTAGRQGGWRDTDREVQSCNGNTRDMHDSRTHHLATDGESTNRDQTVGLQVCGDDVIFFF